MTVFIAPDKFRGTATSREIVEAVTERCHERGVPTDAQVMSDGGEGFRSAFPGDTKSFRVSDPWGTPVIVEITTFVSPWGRLGVFEMAEVIGRHIVTHPTGEQALQALVWENSFVKPSRFNLTDYSLAVGERRVPMAVPVAMTFFEVKR